MAIIGFIFVVALAVYCFVAAVALMMASHGLTGKGSIGTPILLAISMALFWLAYEFSPFTVAFKAL